MLTRIWLNEAQDLVDNLLRIVLIHLWKPTLFFIYSRETSGNSSHLLWYWSVMVTSLLVRWFFNCRPAAVLATELQFMFANTSDSALRNSEMFDWAACSKNVLAANNSFGSMFARRQRKNNTINKLVGLIFDCMKYIIGRPMIKIQFFQILRCSHIYMLTSLELNMTMNINEQRYKRNTQKNILVELASSQKQEFNEKNAQIR